MSKRRTVSSIVAGLALLTVSGVRPAAAYQAQPDVRPSAELAPEQKLVRVRRIYVESFGDDPVSKQVQAMVIDALVRTKRFVVTENRDNAEATLKGTAVERTSQELHSFSEGGTAATAVARGHDDGSWRRAADVIGVLQAAGVQDSQAKTETVDNARISVRLVDSGGDVLWSTTQESEGAKYKGAGADAADKVARQLVREVTRLERTPTP